MPIQDYKVSKDSTFIVPIVIDEASSTIEAVDETIDIYFQDTLLNVLANDDLGFEPTNIISVTSSIPSSVGTFTIEDNKIKFTKGIGTIVTPQTFSYTIKDVTNAESTADVTVNISDVPVLPIAQDETFSVNDFDVINLDVLNNDALGTTPTTIVSFDDRGLTCGAITNNGTDVTFTPNGIYGVSETFDYTIEDSLAKQSTATVTLNVSHYIGSTETAKISLGTISTSGVCSRGMARSFIIETQVAGEITDGDIAYNNDLTPFDGLDYYYRAKLDSAPLVTYVLTITSDGTILIQGLC